MLNLMLPLWIIWTECKTPRYGYTLINDLLALSRVSANNKNLEFTPVDLNVIILDVLSDLEGSVEYYGGYVCIDTLPVINADALQIRQLLQNILSNGLKFHRVGIGPEISVSWQNQTDFAKTQHSAEFYGIAIADKSIGIDPQYADKIFIPFQRLHGKNEYEGTVDGMPQNYRAASRLYTRVACSRRRG